MCARVFVCCEGGCVQTFVKAKVNKETCAAGGVVGAHSSCRHACEQWHSEMKEQEVWAPAGLPLRALRPAAGQGSCRASCARTACKGRTACRACAAGKGRAPVVSVWSRPNGLPMAYLQHRGGGSGQGELMRGGEAGSEGIWGGGRGRLACLHTSRRPLQP